VDNAFSAASPFLNLIAYPETLGSRRKAILPPKTHMIGPCVRDQALPEGVLEIIQRQPDDDPRLYVTLGSSLSYRADILDTIVEAMRVLPINVILASGVNPADRWDPIHKNWSVRPVWPQSAVLEHCDVVISHGGNNTVMETLQVGIPQVVAPLSTAQFAGAADLERTGLGVAVDANTVDPLGWRHAVWSALNDASVRRAERIRKQIRKRPGPRRAVDLMLKESASWERAATAAAV
jgi:MGT family glycosyltransferase